MMEAPRRIHAISRGFTLVELVVTVVLVGLLSSVALPLAEMTAQRNKEQALRIALRQIRTAIDAYKQAGDDGRIVRKVGASGYPKTLMELVDGVEDAKSPNHAPIYFLRRIPPDPFASGNMMSPQLTWGLRSYDSSADSPGEGNDVFDVYSMSRGNGLNGVPYRNW